MTTATHVVPAVRRVLERMSPFGVARRPVDWLVDSALFALALALWWWNGLPEVHPQVPDWFWPIDRALGLLTCLLIWWTRRYPVFCAILALPASAVTLTGAFPTLVVLYRLAQLARPVVSVLLTALHIAVALPYHAVVPLPGLGWEGWLLFVFLIYLLALCLGFLARARGHSIDALRESAARDRESYERRIVDARRTERERIAREMHDVLAHRISLLSVHAGALEFRAGSATALSTEEVRQAATVIRENAHLAVEDLRALLDLLRHDGDELGTGPPQPRLADVADLVREAQAAGQRVDLLVEVDGSQVRDSVQRTAYRVVQESLTNARKHASGCTVHVRVTGGDDGVRVLVDNAVPVGVTNTDLRYADLRAGRADRPDPESGGGTGLIGLAERVRLDGGTLSSGIESGRFRVYADLPGGTP